MSALALQQLDKSQLADFLPHKGPMVLLDRVESWDENAIHCSTSSHNDGANPLRIAGRLSTVHAMEYGAQAAAVHLFLLAGSGLGPVADGLQSAGEKIVYLGVVRDFEFSARYLDDQPDSTLQIHSELISAAPRIVQYRVCASISDIPYSQGIISLIVGN